MNIPHFTWADVFVICFVAGGFWYMVRLFRVGEKYADEKDMDKSEEIRRKAVEKAAHMSLRELVDDANKELGKRPPDSSGSGKG